MLEIVAGLGGAIAFGGTIHLPLNERALPGSIYLSQSSIGQCRQLHRVERIYSAGDLAADRIADLPSGTRITLASEVNQPTVGWVRMSYPVTGYIQTAFLVPCGAPAAAPLNPPPVSRPPSTAAICGVVIPPFLTVRSGPATTFPALIDLNHADVFRLTGNTQTQTQPLNEQGRLWVNIERSGITGWVAETGPQGLGNNLQRLPCSSVQLP